MIYKKYYIVTINEKITVRELKSDLPFSKEEGQISLKDRHPDISYIQWIPKTEAKKLQKKIGYLK